MYIINNLRFNFRIFLMTNIRQALKKSAKVLFLLLLLLHFFHTNIVHYTLFLCKNNFTDYHKREINRLNSSFINLYYTKNKLYKASFQGLFSKNQLASEQNSQSNPGFQTNAAVQNIRFNINTVSHFYNLLFITTVTQIYHLPHQSFACGNACEEFL